MNDTPTHMLTDSHCHLNFAEFEGNVPNLIEQMKANGVTRAICISTTLETFDQVHALAMQHPELWASVGVHPDHDDVQEPTLADLIERAQRPRIVAIGETGLDYYRLGERTWADMQWQRERFRTHIEAAKQTRLPLVVHTRQASDDTLAILKEAGSGIAGVFHCFTESIEVARQALDLGFYISFSGIITFRNAQAVRDVVQFVPLERMLIETDSPYLAPTPYRGKTNQPAYTLHVAQQVAQIKQRTLDEVAHMTTANVNALFTRMGANA
jgi:TatD DNase family protein